MSGHGCALAAADLTGVVDRLGRVARLLERQAGVPVDDFGGLSGDAYRRHVTASAMSAVALASDVALLAGALAALGRELDRVAGLRSLGHAARAAEVEHSAQQAWREAVARFSGRSSPLLALAPQPGEPVPPPPTPSPPDVATPPSQPAPAGADPPALEPSRQPTLESELVAPLESEFVPHRRGCGDD